ncbi:hypothetical protein DL96DRAFT_1679308 [Flagelloscypha sp. PMI_526]|nr:hypothetical protein DL96DRAFT_1679308 [Flagelloscypha sp. PMI_526]
MKHAIILAAFLTLVAALPEKTRRWCGTQNQERVGPSHCPSLSRVAMMMLGLAFLLRSEGTKALQLFLPTELDYFFFLSLCVGGDPSKEFDTAFVAAQGTFGHH